MAEFEPEIEAALKGLSAVHRTVVQALLNHPAGLSMVRLMEIAYPEGRAAAHFNRRVRDLDPRFDIERIHRGRETLYVLRGVRQYADRTESRITNRIRAEVLHRDGSRCQMCGRSPRQHDIVLQVDHKIPQSWGGSSDVDNLWALCSSCNQGKKAYFQSFDQGEMRAVLSVRSVHARLARMLEMRMSDWVDSDTLEFVANFNDFQADWQKRLRELRSFGWKIETRKRRVGRRTTSDYRAVSTSPLPTDPAASIRQIERDRATRRH